jgi:simple sugar transport system permease protein
VTATTELSTVERRPSNRLRLAKLRDLALIPPIIALLIYGYTLKPDLFLTKTYLVDTVLKYQTELALVVLAEALVLIVGKFDLSLESVVGLAPAVGAMLVLPAAQSGFGIELPTWLALVAIVLVGAAVGAFNGFLAVKFQLNAFIVTLAMLIVLRGVLVGATDGKTLFELPDAFFTLATTTFLTAPLSVWLALVSFGVAGLMLKYHRWGRALFAIGGNPKAARAAGIRVDRVLLGVYIVAGALAAVGGLLKTGYVGAINANQGQNMIFTVFAAAVIGGISLDGGKGTMFGALTGVLLLGVVDSLLTFAHVPAPWIGAIYGGIILLALVVTRLTTGRAQN